jgi:GR25 family glycosyltransferase involved in LPS biosynthesis
MPKEILMAEMGRPRVLDEIKRSQVVALIASGYGLVGAAKYVGCDPRSIRREAERDDAFDLELREAEKQANLCPLEAIRHKAHTHWRAAAWLLERTEPKRFSKRAKTSMKPSELDRLFESVLDRLILELTDDVLGNEWYKSAAKHAKEKAIQRVPRQGTESDFDRLLAKSMEYFAKRDATGD